MSNFSPFHLGCPLCSTSLLSPLLQLILQNWRMGRSVRAGFGCRCVCNSAVIKCSVWAWVDVPNSRRYLSVTALLCVVIDGGHSRRQPHTCRIKHSAHTHTQTPCVSWHYNTISAAHGACVWSYLLWHNCLYISELGQGWKCIQQELHSWYPSPLTKTINSDSRCFHSPHTFSAPCSPQPASSWWQMKKLSGLLPK